MTVKYMYTSLISRYHEIVSSTRLTKTPERSSTIFQEEQKKILDNQKAIKDLCTQNKTRTCTAVRPLVPETSVSTDSTTWAYIQWTLKKKPCNFPAARPLFCLLSHKDSEPWLTEPKSAVLPLHNGTIFMSLQQRCCYFDAANVEHFFISPKTKCRKIKRKLLFSCCRNMTF